MIAYSSMNIEQYLLYGDDGTPVHFRGGPDGVEVTAMKDGKAQDWSDNIPVDLFSNAQFIDKKTFDNA